MISVSIIIPVYNEEKAVLRTIEEIQNVLKTENISGEIIAVDDGSTDRSRKILGKIEGIDVLIHEENRGYGASLKTGIRNANYEDILIIDADGSYPSEHIPELLKEIEKYDMVVGARIGEEVCIPIVRRPAKFALNKIASYLAETKIPDINSGLRVMKKDIINKFIKILPNKFSFTITITLSMLTNNYRVKYIPINYNKRDGKSKIKPIRDTLNFIQLIVHTVMYFNPLKVFFPIATLFFIPGLIFLIRDLLALNISQASILLIVTGGLILSIGMLADLINRRLSLLSG